MLHNEDLQEVDVRRCWRSSAKVDKLIQYLRQYAQEDRRQGRPDAASSSASAHNRSEAQGEVGFPFFWGGSIKPPNTGGGGFREKVSIDRTISQLL